MVVNQNYHLLANNNSVVFTANLQLTFIILQPLKVVIRYIIIVTYEENIDGTIEE
ncbi:7209_t:CDS:2 [Rhizophagus irregularis]|nr:7209_t:CDS:2 [Rhizophagus irregularis]